MIRHTVLFKIKPTIAKQEIDKIFTEMHTLKEKLFGIASIVTGECLFHEEKSAKRLRQFFTHGFSIDFKDQEALNAFFNDPVTHPVKDKIVEVTEGGYDAIIGFDFHS